MQQNIQDTVCTSLQKIVELDVYVTNQFVQWANLFLPSDTLRFFCKILEVSTHKLLLYVCWITFVCLTINDSLCEMQINMALGLALDALLLALLKLLVRRGRPQDNVDDMFGKMHVDEFSCPSGHASRSTFIAYFFIHFCSPSPALIHLLITWTTLLCFSRVLLNRHYVLDIVGGVVLGVFEGWLVGLLWMEQSALKRLWFLL